MPHRDTSRNGATRTSCDSLTPGQDRLKPHEYILHIVRGTIFGCAFPIGRRPPAFPQDSTGKISGGIAPMGDWHPKNRTPDNLLYKVPMRLQFEQGNYIQLDHRIMQVGASPESRAFRLATQNPGSKAGPGRGSAKQSPEFYAPACPQKQNTPTLPRRCRGRSCRARRARTPRCLRRRRFQNRHTR